VNLSHHLIARLRRTLAGLQYPDVPVTLELPPSPDMGDRSCTVALALAKPLKRAPRQIAQEILQALPPDDPWIDRVEIAGPGYLNFFWSREALRQVLRGLRESGPDYGSSDLGAGERRLFEFVSANPTGPLNIVSARAAAVGDSLVRVQRKIGFDAQSEFYVNDAGRQVDLLGESVRARLREALGRPLEIPEGGYHGIYVRDLAEQARQEFPGDPLTAPARDLGRWTAQRIVAGQRETLEAYGVAYHRWFFESEIHQSGAHWQTLERLKQEGHIYEKDGALYFRSSAFGDDDDRVVVTSDGRPTYFLPDIAYHLDKAGRGYAKAVDLWGPDHHGHVGRMQAAMRALGLPVEFLEVVIVQQVNLLRGGQPVKMSKRTGEMITMDELIEEVGSDAARQIFLSRRWSSPLDFDIEMAKDRSEKSPIFYVQYAHARISSIFRKAGDGEELQESDLEALHAPEEWDLLRSLSLFPDAVETAGLQLAPHRINTYLSDLATSFHRFYHECRVLSDDPALTRARLALCRAVQVVLKEGLRLMGMSAPDQM